MNFFGKILLIFYQIISTLILPILLLLVFWRKIQGKEHPHRFIERFAFTKFKRPENCILLWLHAVSVGESNSAWVLIEDLIKSNPNVKILFTSTTTTSSQIISQKIESNALYQDRIIHQFLPLDSFFIVLKFFQYWRPRACIFIESEIWPNFIYLAQSKKIPAFLINARISKKSASRWYFLKILGVNIFNNFSAIFAQSYQDQKILENLVDRGFCTTEIFFEGNLKSQSKILNFDKVKLQDLKQQIGNRKIFLCASTHCGEEKLLLKVHDKLKLQFPNLLTIIILRHPPRVNDVKILLKNHNFVTRSQTQIHDQEILPDTEIYLVDTIGEMGIFYSLADFAFIGGSLFEDIGGHNPIEAIQLNCAIISGCFYKNNSAIYEDLLLKNGCKIIRNESDLFDVVVDFYNNTQIIDDINNNAQKIIVSAQDISQKIANKIITKLNLNQ